MCMNVKLYQEDIRKYCDSNNLSYDKIMKTLKGCGSDSITFQVSNGETTTKGLLDETPLPTVLILKKIDGGIKFEQTEFTKKYLSM